MTTLTTAPAPRAVSAATLHRTTLGFFRSLDLGETPSARRAAAGILWRHDGERILVRSTVEPSNLPADARSRVEPALDLKSGDEVALLMTVDATLADGRAARSGEIADWLAVRLDGAVRIGEVFQASAAPLGLGDPINRIRVAVAVEVDDPETLEVVLRVGIGKNKSYGCGLITVQTL